MTTTSYALFSHHLSDAAFSVLATRLNDRPGYFAKHIPDAHTLTDAGLAKVMQGGVSVMTFAVIGITGPVAELGPFVRILNTVKVPCAIVLCCEGYTALRRAKFTDGKKVNFTFLLKPGPWDGGFESVFTLFKPGRTREFNGPRFTPALADVMAPYLRQAAAAAG